MSTSSEEESTVVQDFSDSTFGTTLVQSLDSLRHDGLLCDYTIDTKSSSIKVHKCVLAAASDYFKVMFLGSLKESTENHVDLSELPEESLSSVINFIYTGKLSLSFDNISEVVHVASHLQAQSALCLVCKYLTFHLTFDTADSILKIADMYALQSVIDFYDKMVCTDFASFVETDTFLELTCKEICKYLSSDSLQPHSEYCILDWAAKWLRHTKDLNDTSRVLQTVRFSLMSPEEMRLLRSSPFWVQYKDILEKCCSAPKDPLLDCPLPKNCQVRSDEESLVFLTHGPFGAMHIVARDADNEFYNLQESMQWCNEIRGAVLDNMLYLAMFWGDVSGEFSSFKRFDPRNLKMYDLAPMRSVCRGPTLSACGSKLYLLGGIHNSNLSSSTSIYCCKTDKWTEGTDMPTGRYSHCTAVIDNLMYISGGMENTTQHGRSQPSSSALVFNTDEQTWTKIASMNYGRRLHEMVPFKGNLYVFGGILEPKMLEVPVERYCINTQQWTVLDISSISGFSFGHFMVMQNKILCYGHEHKEAGEDEIWEFDTSAKQWGFYTRCKNCISRSPAVCVVMKVNFNDVRVVKCSETKQFRV